MSPLVVGVTRMAVCSMSSTALYTPPCASIFFLRASLSFLGICETQMTSPLRAGQE